MSEPFAQFGDLGELGLPAPWLALATRGEDREARVEQRAEAERLAELEDRAEARLYNWMQQRARQLEWERRPFDPSRPETMVETPAEMASRAFAAMDEPEMTITAPVSALVAAGLVTRLDGSPAKPPPPAKVYGVEGEQAARSRRMAVHGARTRIRFARQRAKETIR